MNLRLMSRATGISLKGKSNPLEILLCSAIFTATTSRPWSSDSTTTDNSPLILVAATSLNTQELGSKMRSPSLDNPLPIVFQMSIS